jgi:Protein of unknown function (DUF4231)
VDSDRVVIVNASVSDSIKYFSKTGRTNRVLYYWFGGTQVALAVLVPIFALVPGGGTWAKLAAAAAGAATAFVKGLDSLWRPHETWLRASSTVSRLWNERFLFQTAAGKYASATDRAGLYAESVEAIFDQEAQTWVKTSESSDNKPQGD